MKIVQINATCGIGSTGKICEGISKLLTQNDIENYILFSCLTDSYPLGISCSERDYIKIQALKSKLRGNFGFNSKRATKTMIDEIERIAPDIIHLHNIHSHDCDLNMLFTYFKKRNIKLVWTFHDCWAFTGYCTYFDMVKCDKWKKECYKCVVKNEYSLFFDKSSINFKKKKELFSGLNLTIVTPSLWLRNLVKQSFFKDYPIKIINNGIDLDIFKPIFGSFRQRNGLENKKIVLGVSFGWDKRKGLDVFINLANRLPSDYKIVLVGTDENIDKFLPKSIVSIHKTQNVQELVEIYTTADVFINPTREDNYPTVNMEAIACGTPVISFNTGGSSEMLDETCAVVVSCNDMLGLENEIIRICTDDTYSTIDCIKKAKEFDKNDRFKEYLDLYERIIFR